MSADANNKKLTIIVTKGTLDWGLSALHPGDHGRGHGR